jgi:ribosome biogenesis protein Tsr3
MLNDYANAKDSAEIVSIQNEYLEAVAKRC